MDRVGLTSTYVMYWIVLKKKSSTRIFKLKKKFTPNQCEKSPT